MAYQKTLICCVFFLTVLQLLNTIGHIMNGNGPKAIDLFCGCGGISSGLRQAGFNIVAGVDIEPKY